jgi:hypothetical protein
MKASQLTPRDRSRYAELKSTIKDGIMGIAEALYEIRESKLYLDEYKSFTEFIECECDYSRQRVYQLIKAVEGQKKLTNKLDNAGQVNSRVAAELANVPEEYVQQVMDKATDGGQKAATASAIKRVSGEIVQDSKPVTSSASTSDTNSEKFRKLRSVAKQHNAAMIRAIDSMNDLILNPGTHRKLVQHYEAIDKLLEGWPVANC